MDNNYQSSAFEASPDAIFPWKTTSYSAILAVKHTDNGKGTPSTPSTPSTLSTPSTIYNNVNRIVFDLEVSSLHTYPPRMLSMHQVFHSLNNMSLINVRSADLFLYIYRDFENCCNRAINALLSIIYKDISINLLYKPKKEVSERKMTLKHCKVFQCKTRRTAWRKVFFNN